MGEGIHCTTRSSNHKNNALASTTTTEEQPVGHHNKSQRKRIVLLLVVTMLVLVATVIGVSIAVALESRRLRNSSASSPSRHIGTAKTSVRFNCLTARNKSPRHHW
jgi:heme/copper-type cytochrome/quinol oxidase subunit 2